MRKALFHFGRYLLMLGRLFRSMEKPGVYWRATMLEAVSIGIGSLTIVLVISVFIGAVMTVQTVYQLSNGTSFFPRSIVGYVVSASTLLEMGPTVTSLVLAGKVGSSIASQLGTMRITEQIDALDVMGVNSSSFLVLPKLLGALIVFPLLIITAAFFIHGGGITAGVLTGSISAQEFASGVQRYHDPFYVTFMLVKSVTFAFIITSISAYEGYHVTGGAVGVGQAGTRAVVGSCIVILIADYVLAQILL